MKNALSVILEANDNNIYLWKEKNSSNISFSYDKSHGFLSQLKEQISNNKNEILSILLANQVETKEKAKSITYYKLPDQSCEPVLSDIQKGIYLQTKLDKSFTTYTEPVLLKLSFSINLSLLKQAIIILVNKYNILRINIIEDFKYTIRDASTIQVTNLNMQENSIHTYIKEQQNHIFNLQYDQLIKFEIVEVVDKEYYLLNMTHHHIISDAYSVLLLISEVMENYNQLLNNSTYQLTPSIFPDYSDFANYQLSKVETSSYLKKREALLDKLATCVPIKLMTKNIQKINNTGNSFTINLDVNLYSMVQQLGKKYNVSVYSILATSFYYVLSLYNENKNKFAIGTTVSNRPYGFENTIGPFISTLPLVLDFDISDSILQNALRCQTELINLNQYNLINLNKLAQNSQKLSIEIQEIIHVMFTMHNYQDIPFHKEFKDGLEILPVVENTEKFGLSVIADEIDDGCRLTVSYLSDLYEDGYIKQVFDEYCVVLNALNESNILNTFTSIQLLTSTEYQKVIYDWNKTDSLYPEDKTIHQLFEDQVNKTPGNIAIIYQDIKFTYDELNLRANQLAHYLKDTYKIKGDDLIILCLDRSEYMLVAILSILKSGGAYVPIDPIYPDDRMSYILKDTKSKIVLTEQKHKNKMLQVVGGITQTTVYAIDDDSFGKQLQQQSMINPEASIESSNLAYVIYTSGTTGNPKGVMLTHKGIVNRIMWMNDKYPLSATDRILQKTPYVFDVSVWELFWANWFGACIVFAKTEGHKDAEYLLKIIETADISILHFVPSMLDVFNQALANQSENYSINKQLNRLRHVFCSGESLKPAQVNKTYKHLPHIKIHNLYGPTEASIDVLSYDCSINNQVYIGKPISNIQAYVLDSSSLAPVPIGVIGELCLSGVGLARGYLNQPKLTKEKFVINPFQSAEDKKLGKNGILYKTGDLVRHLSDGNIEYLGRNDSQVKIRGYRIELGEIENRLNHYRGIDQSVVLVKEETKQKEPATCSPGQDETSSNTKYIVGYYVSKQQLNQEEILDHLANKLPEYMLPRVLLHLTQLPLTINGKLDKKSLPLPKSNKSNNYVAPKNQIQEMMCSIWQKVLQVEKVGITDDFFRNGGDSIRSVQVVAELNKHGLNYTVHDLIEYRTVDRLTQILSTKNGITERVSFDHHDASQQLKQSVSSDSVIAEVRSTLLNKYNHSNHKVNLVMGNIDFIIPTTQMQKSIIYDYLKYPGAYHFQYGYLLDRVQITKDMLDEITQLVYRTDIFRTYFICCDSGEIYQIVRKKVDFNINVIKLECDEAEVDKDDSIITQGNGHKFDAFDGNEVLIKINIYQINHQKNILHIAIHHAIMDGWSNIIFLNHIWQIMFKNHRSAQPLLSKPFHEYCNLEHTFKNNIQYKSFWSKYLANYKYYDLVYHGNSKGDNYKTVGITLLPAYNQAINDKINTLNIQHKSYFMFLIMQELLKLYKCSDLCLGVVTNNRLSSIKNAINSLGMHWSFMPIRVGLQTQPQVLNHDVMRIDAQYGRYPLSSILKDQNAEQLFFATFKYINFHHAADMNGEIERMRLIFVNDFYAYPINFTILVNHHCKNHMSLHIDYLEQAITDDQIQKILCDVLAQLF